MKIIYTKNLSKVYKRFEKEEGLIGSFKSLFKRKTITKEAIKSINLEINEGEFIGLIGPNGAGKTTIIKMLTGIIAPSSGEIDVLGFKPNELKNGYKRQYAVVMGQKSQLFFELTAADSFLLFKEIYNIPEDVYRENLKYFIDLFNVKHLLDVQVRTLSLGERMKMELIAALLHNPKILYLDEPTIGLDATSQKQIRMFLKEINEKKKTTIILTSHYMEDIKSLCNRCIVVNEGNKIYDGDLDFLFDSYQTHKIIKITFDEKVDYIPKDVTVLSNQDYKLTIKAKKERVKPLLKEIMSINEISDISVEEDDISDVVERIYNKEVVK